MITMKSKINRRSPSEDRGFDREFIRVAPEFWAAQKRHIGYLKITIIALLGFGLVSAMGCAVQYSDAQLWHFKYDLDSHHSDSKPGSLTMTGSTSGTCTIETGTAGQCLTTGGGFVGIYSTVSITQTGTASVAGGNGGSPGAGGAGTTWVTPPQDRYGYLDVDNLKEQK